MSTTRSSPSAPSSTASTARHRRRRRWVAIVGACLVVALVAAGVWVWRDRRADARTAAEPSTVTVTLEPYRVTVAGPGTLEAVRSLKVTSEAAGTVLELVDVGERVAAGQVVARLDPEPFERAVQEAELALEKARANLAGLEVDQVDSSGDRTQSVAEAEQRVAAAQRAVDEAQGRRDLVTELHAIGSESAEAVRAAENALQAAREDLAGAQSALARARESRDLQGASDAQQRRDAELAVAQAELDLEDARDALGAVAVTAPFAGVVADVVATEGAFVAGEGALLTLIDDATLALPVQIDETEIGPVEVGQTAEVALDAVPGATFAGTVTAIAPVAQIESNIPVFYVTVTLENPELRMRPGMTAEADIAVETYEAVATVPLEAVQEPSAGATGGAVERPGGALEATPGEERNAGAGGAAGDGSFTPPFAGAGTNGPPGGGGQFGGAQFDRASGEAPSFAGSGADSRPPAGGALRTDARVVMVEGDDGEFEPRAVTLVDSLGFEAVVRGDLADGDVILVPAGSTTARTAGGGEAAPQRSEGFPAGGGFSGGGPPGGGFR